MIEIHRIDTTNFDRAIRALAGYTGKSLPDVVDAEAGKILEGAVRNMPATPKQKIVQDQQGKKWRYIDTGRGKKLYYSRNRYPDAVWGRLREGARDSLNRHLKSRGLGKKSFVMLAEALGLPIKTAKQWSRATPSNGRPLPGNLTLARRSTNRDRYGLKFSNAQSGGSSFPGRQALLKSINGRTAFFNRQLKLGTFKDLKAIARAYPGLRVT